MSDCRILLYIVGDLTIRKLTIVMPANQKMILNLSEG
jgi:hypothetical protein